MNHNAEHCMDVDARNKARDWGEAQLQSCADWGVQLSFRRAWIYLWLNYHTVHHLFPRLDFSHHPAAQAIIIEVRVCASCERVARLCVPNRSSLTFPLLPNTDLQGV